MIIKNLVVRLLKAEEKKLEKIIRNAQSVIRKAPEGNVEIRQHKKSVQFYRRMDPSEKHGVYMHAAEYDVAKALIQKRYLERLVHAAKKQLSVILRFLNAYNPDCLKDVFLSQSTQRRKIISPVELPDDLYIQKWLSLEYEPKGFKDGTPEHYTKNHERVRSKSEVLIADSLYEAGIPYRYECPLNISGRIIHPDFTVLRISDRKVFYWEHLGIMDDSEYRNNAILRIRDYEAVGIFPGDSLITTMETNKIPINRNVIERIINHFLS